MTFLKAARYLKSISQAAKPIRVRRLPLSGLDGSCEERPDYFLIKINKHLTETHCIDVLLHEVAHADAWDKDEQHGPAWGVCYSRLYRLWEKHLLGK